jgi:hypothetical protein
MVAMERPKSPAICFSGMLFFRRQFRNAVAKLARMSRQSADDVLSGTVLNAVAGNGRDARICPVQAV